MGTKHLAIALLTGFGLLASASSTLAVSPESVQACTSEAQSAYGRALRMEPSLRPVILSHRKRMSEACTAFIAGKTTSTAALTRCLREASMGPIHVQRARNLDAPHVARQNEACRALGAGR